MRPSDPTPGWPLEDDLFWLDVRCSHHFGPLLGIAQEQFFKFRGSSLERDATELAKPRIERWIGKAGIDLFVEECHDLGWRLSTRSDAEPNARLVTRHEFADCR